MTFSITITLLFLLYSIFWLQVPGMLFCDILLPRRLKFSSRLLAGYFIGFMYMAALYYMESLLKVPGIIMVAGPVTSIIAIIYYFKKGRPSIFNAGERFRLTYLIIFVFIYMASAFGFQLKYLFAFSGQTTQVYHDFLFHTGNIASLSRSFPNTDIRISGLTFYYHYYYELIFAMCKHIFKMDAFRVYMNGNALVCAFPLTLALVTLGERIRGVKSYYNFEYFFFCFGLLVSGICLLPLNVVGGRFPLSWMDNHFFTNGNAMGLAMSLTILTIDVLTEIWYDKLVFRNVIAIYLLGAAATGFKGTTGILLVAITWIVFVVELIIIRHFHVQQLLYNLALTTGFALTYVLVTVGLNPSGANNRAMQLTCAGTLDSGRVGQLFARLGLDYMAMPWVIFAVILTVFFIWGPCVLPFIGFTIEKFQTLFKEGVIGDVFDWFAIGSVLMGTIGFCFVSVPGQSQVYFVITNAGLLFYCAMRYLVQKRVRLIYKYMQIWFAICTAVLIFDVANYCRDDFNQTAIFHTPSDGRADLVSEDTMEAYFWLRDNTPEDSIIAVDKFSEELDYRNIYFYASAFSERQCYIEGYDYSDVTESRVEGMLSLNETFFTGDMMERDVSIEVNGINYLVATQQAHPDYEPLGIDYEKVFENSEVTIYKCNGRRQ
ncbi:MAG: hypothetical protein IJR96_07615 [Pseudobutyrivibrio sp.]|nr:hypothetical protein [Pseudobutyrivibrio sp.]